MTKHIPQRLQIIGILIIAMGILLRTIGLFHGLPYVDEMDESIIRARGWTELRGQGAEVDLLQGYPPGIVSVHKIGILLTSLFTAYDTNSYAGIAFTIVIIRILSLIVSIIGLISASLIAYRMSNAAGGILAALCFSIFPTFIEQSTFGLSEGFLMLFVLFTFGFALLILENHEKKRGAFYALASIICAWLSILFKYSVFPILGLPFGAIILNLLKRTHRRLWAMSFTLQVIVSLIFSGWLLFGHNVLRLANGGGSAESKSFLERGIFELVLNSKGIDAIQKSSGFVYLSPVFLLGIILIITVILAGKQNKDHFRAWLLLVFGGFVLAWLVPSYLVYDRLWERYLTPATTLFTLAMAIGLGSLWQYEKFIRVLKIFVVGAGCFWILPGVVEVIPFVYQRTLTDTRMLAGRWAMQAIPIGNIAVDDDTHFTFSGFWGNYPDPFRDYYYRGGSLFSMPVEQWHKEGVLYAAFSEATVAMLRATPELQKNYLDQMLLLKTISNQQRRGPAILIYRSQRPQIISNINLDGLYVVGFNAAWRGTGSKQLTLRLFWQLKDTANSGERVQIIQRNTRKNTWNVLLESSPRALYPMTAWNDDQEIIEGDEWTINIQHDGNFAESELMIRRCVPAICTGDGLLQTQAISLPIAP